MPLTEKVIKRTDASLLSVGIPSQRVLTAESGRQGTLFKGVHDGVWLAEELLQNNPHSCTVSALPLADARSISILSSTDRPKREAKLTSHNLGKEKQLARLVQRARSLGVIRPLWSCAAHCTALSRVRLGGRGRCLYGMRGADRAGRHGLRACLRGRQETKRGGGECPSADRALRCGQREGGAGEEGKGAERSRHFCWADRRFCSHKQQKLYRGFCSCVSCC